MTAAATLVLDPLVVPVQAWLVLAAVLAAGLLVDLFGHRGHHANTRASAIAWSLGWVALALGFAGWVGLRFGRDAAEDFVTAWLVEKSLSLDNLFVFIVIFARLQIPKEEQRRVLVFGILGALVTRAAFIASGSALLSTFHGVTYVLGALLVYTAVKTLGDPAKGPEGDGRVLTFLKRHLPFTPDLRGHRFTVVERGRRSGTPLLLALIVIEITDVAFAIDSIPAVFSISQTPFIVYGSNVFAALGLRALFIVLADLLADLKYLRFALAGILGFTGVKMLTGPFVHIPHVASLLVIATILVAAIVPSVVSRRRGHTADIRGIARKTLWEKLRAPGIADADVDADAGHEGGHD